MTAATVALVSLHCTPDSKDLLYEPVPIEAHDVKIAADAEGDAKSPAHVAVFMKRGILQMKGGGSHTLEGVATGAVGDAPPRLALMQDRVALQQSAIGGSTPRGDAKFVLALGVTPMILEVDTGIGEAQSIDLGGVSLRQARLHTSAGHLSVDWSAANPLPGATLSLATEAGYIELTHLGRSGVTGIEVTNVAGLVRLDMSDLAAAPPAEGDRPTDTSPIVTVTTVTAKVTSGKLVLKVPKSVAASATVDAPASAVVAKGWTAGDLAGSFFVGDPKAARVVARVSATAGQVELQAE